MYCQTCNCEFSGWRGRCPVCKADLVDVKPTKHVSQNGDIAYEDLVQLVEDQGGRLDIDLATTAVGFKRTWTFPYFGFGRAWASRMQGSCEAASVDLETSEVGMDAERRFPYFGHGYAWAKDLKGDIGGNDIHLTATKVARKRSRGFPYLGYGMAWVEQLSGECGDRLEVDLSVTEMGSRKRWAFPYKAYGYGWAKRGMLTLKLRS